MKELLVRLFCLLVCISLIIFQLIQGAGHVTLSIFLLTIMLLLYFLLPLLKQALSSYLIILFIIPLLTLVSVNLVYVLPLFAFFLLEGTFRLKERQFFIFLCTSIIISLAITILQWIPIYSFLLLIAIHVCCYFLHQHVEQREMKDSLYDQLLAEFRQLKRLSVEQEEFVRAEERTKIARDIHDSVGHKLTTLLMQLEMHSITNDRVNLEDVKQLARESLEETRFAVRQLKTAETTGIQSVLHLIRKLEMESRLHIRFTLEKGVLSLPISNEQSIVLYRVLQECLTNAMKHSHSKEVDVIIGTDSLQQIQFEVKNKLLSDTPIIYGFGLTNMEERLQEIGGNLRIIRTAHEFIVKGTFSKKLS
ncbi:sensor histidine kinase [Lysinibacillus sp. BW-2-10]|uniref:sensor histidine kinase n=1 Tax=Lysinibacillus sp. BW-2-10 TaxID=2590030 RepID=UPI00117DD163|nr:histidine kinase [Lysinibacillus sp. BW-2-10]TSI03378.1 sensor histidine kinase [Lysinibacillus sp. BW-2-10]